MSTASSQAGRRSAAPHYQPLMIVLVAVCGGIVVDRYGSLPLGLWWITAFVAWTAWLVLWRRKRDEAAGVMLWIAAAACGGAWYHCHWSLFAEDDLARFARRHPQPVCAEAVVVKGPQRLPAPSVGPMQVIPYGDRTRLEVQFVGLRDGDTWRPASGRARVSVDGHLLAVQVGDRLRIFGQVSTPSPACNPGAFDYAAYLRAARISAMVETPYPDCITVLDRPWFGGPARWIDRLRVGGHAVLWQHLAPERVPLAAALLLGIREELGSERSDVFLETGTVHLLSVSGLHVGIIATSLLYLFSWTLMPRRLGAVVVAVAVVVYVLLSGAETPAVRAAILVLMLCAGQVLGLRPLPMNSLAAAALVVLALNPADLFNIGAQLSFLSVAGLLWYAPRRSEAAGERDPLERLVWESRPRLYRATAHFLRNAWNVAALSAVVWSLTLPLVMARFHVVALAAVGLNVLLWIPASVGLVAGFALLAVGGVCSPLAMVLGWCCDKSLWMLEALIAAARALPASCAWVPGPSDWWLAGFYGGLGVLAAFPAVRPPRRWCAALLASWCTVGLLASAAHRNKDALECTVLSVGHGSAVVVELPSGQTLLYDAGKLAAPDSAMQSIAGCLWEKGITHIDAIVLSHPDADHYNAVPALVQRFSVGVVYVSPVMFARENRSLNALQEALRASRIPVQEIRAGDRLASGTDCRVEVFHPPGRGVVGSDNANSIVLALECGGRRILLPGDLEPPGLQDMVAEEAWDCDVLLAPHHGSRQSDPPGLAAWCRPEWVVISGGRERGASKPGNVYRTLGCRILHTAETGAVRVRIEEGNLHVTGLLASDGERPP
jgi:competence protein ComEC